MKLKVSTYLILMLSSFSILMLSYDLSLGLIYLVSCTSILLSFHIFIIPRRFYFVLLITSISLTLTYLIRPLVLIPNLNLFYYTHLGNLNYEIIYESLMKIALYSFTFLGSLYLGLKFFPFSKNSLTTNLDPPPFLIKKRTTIHIVLVTMLLLKAFLVIILGVGIKGLEIKSGYAFLLRFIPEDIIYLLCVMYLIKYKSYTTKKLRIFYIFILIGFSLLILLTGSKAFILRLLLVLLIFSLIYHENLYIKTKVFVFGILLGMPLAALSFEISGLVKEYVISHKIGLGVFEYISENLNFSSSKNTFIYYLDKITGRFIGFDGLVVTDLYQPEFFQDVFSTKETFQRVLSKTIPLYEHDGLSSGKAIGIIYSNHNEDILHSGAVGLYGSFQLMLGELAILGIMVYGLLFGIFFRFSEYFKNEDLSIVLKYLGTMTIILLTMSGNFDFSLSLFLIAIGQMFVFIYLVKFLHLFLKKLKIIKLNI